MTEEDTNKIIEILLILVLPVSIVPIAPPRLMFGRANESLRRSGKQKIFFMHMMYAIQLTPVNINCGWYDTEETQLNRIETILDR